MKAKSIKEKAQLIKKAERESKRTRLINHYLFRVWVTKRGIA